MRLFSNDLILIDIALCEFYVFGIGFIVSWLYFTSIFLFYVT